MTDREMLELAAKAAGMVHMKYAGGSGLSRMLDPSRPETTGSIGPCWNPLTDDGDALRLAGRLHIGVRSHATDHWFHPNLAVALWDVEAKGGRVVVENGDDPQRAIRRAIVRAAAAIQQAKEAQ